MFLFPERTEATQTYKVYIRTPERTELNVRFEGEILQPVFSNGGTPYDLGYQIESVFFDSKSGNRLHGWLMQPYAEENIKATVLFLHGNAANILSHFSIVHPLINRGYSVLLFDYSGFGFSEGNAGRKQVFKDAEAALHYLKSRPEAANKPVLIYGQSLGGNLAPVVAVKNTDMVDALVIEGAFSSHDDVAAYATGLGFIARIAVKEMYASKKYVEQWHKPVLIIHSTEDAIVPYFMGQRIYENANQPKDFYSIGGAHITGPIYYTDSICQKINLMLEK